MKPLLLIALLFVQSNGTVRGTLRFSDGTPAAETVMRLVPADANQPQPRFPEFRAFALVDEDGSFKFDAPPGRYFIRADRNGTVYYPGVQTQAEARSVVVTGGVEIADVNFSLTPAASGVRVRGHVSIPDDYPEASKLRVQTLERWDGSPIAPDGTFEFEHLPPGRYPLIIDAPGVEAVLVTVADHEISGVELTVPPLIPVRATVTIEGNAARPPFQLAFASLPPPGAASLAPPYRSAANAASGAVSTSLPPGQYQLAITKLPDGYYLKAIEADAADLIGNPLTVSATGPPVRITIAIGTSRGVRVSGRVTTTEGDRSSLPEKLTLTGVATSEQLEASLNADRSFEFSKVMPGTYDARMAVTSGVSSPPITVTVPNRDVTDLDIPFPAQRQISGRVAVDGNGPPPKFSLLLMQGKKVQTDSSRVGTLPSVSPSTMASLLEGQGRGAQVLKVDINALAGGSFTMKVPEGEYQVAAIPSGFRFGGAIPAAYFLRSLTSNSADLMTEPLRVSGDESTEIYAGFGTTAADPFVKVSGRVAGLNPSRGVFRVALESDVTSAIETFIDAEGKFEFPSVLPRNSYTARIVPSLDAASLPRVTVADKDVTGLKITVAPEREVTVRVTMESNYPIPHFALSLEGDEDHTALIIPVRPESDGTFTVKLPDDERPIGITGLPLGCEVKTFTYDKQEMRVGLTTDPAVPWGGVRGRVTGLNPDGGSVNLVLNGISTYAEFETTLNADGSFNFSRIPQGTYLPSLKGTIEATRLAAAPIVVSGSDLAGIEIQAPLQSERPRPASDEKPAGATISELGGASPATANESAAIANLRTINTAQVTFLSASGGKYGTLAQLIDAGLLDDAFMNTKAGFNYSVIALGEEYDAAAVPASPATGRFGFFSTPDAVVRYSTFQPLAPDQQGGHAVE